MTLYNILVLHFCCCSPKVKKKNTHQQAKTASLEEKVQVNEGGKSGVSCCNDKTKPDTVANKNHCPISNDSCLSFSGG